MGAFKIYLMDFSETACSELINNRKGFKVVSHNWITYKASHP